MKTLSRYRRAVSIALAVVVSTPVLAVAGWVMTDEDGNETLISKGMMRASWEGGAIVLDSNKNRIAFVDDSRKMVAQGTIDEFCDGAKGALDSALQGMPEEQREMMKRMMQQKSKPPKVEVVDKGNGGKVSGFDTKHYQVMVNDELYEDLWVTRDKALVADCGAVWKAMGEFASCMASISAMGAPMQPEATPEYAKVFDLGMVVQAKSAKEGEGGSKFDVSSIEKRDVPADAFELPGDYRKVPIAEMWQSPGMGGE